MLNFFLTKSIRAKRFREKVLPMVVPNEQTILLNSNGLRLELCQSTTTSGHNEGKNNLRGVSKASRLCSMSKSLPENQAFSVFTHGTKPNQNHQITSFNSQ